MNSIFRYVEEYDLSNLRVLEGAEPVVFYNITGMLDKLPEEVERIEVSLRTFSKDVKCAEVSNDAAFYLADDINADLRYIHSVGTESLFEDVMEGRTFRFTLSDGTEILSDETDDYNLF